MSQDLGKPYCPDCRAVMEIGECATPYVSPYGGGIGGVQWKGPAVGADGVREEREYPVFAFRCSRCGLLRLYAGHR